MKRRTFILAAGAAAATAGAAFRHGQRLSATAYYPGRSLGHWLRSRDPVGAPGETLDTDVLIAGAGVAGLTAAWRLRNRGVRDVLLIPGPERHGNAAAGQDGDLRFPTGAHYLPLPSLESRHMREMLSEFGIIQSDPFGNRPTYDERCLVHAPAERVLYRGTWEEGYLPNDSVSPGERAEHARFFALVEHYAAARGSDGRRAFAVPLEQSSADPAFTALDAQTFKAWLDANGFHAPTLRWYLDYCCRDDYGRREHDVSAWAGLHYFCSRSSQASNAERGAVLTWPEGLQALTAKLAAGALANEPLQGASIARLEQIGDRVEALCVVPAGTSFRVVRVRARAAIAALPLYMLQHVLVNPERFGFEPRTDIPRYAPWLVSNFLLSEFPQEQPGTPLSWDNVVYREPGLGYVVSTHQDIRLAPPKRTAFTAYHALSDLEPEDGRQWLEQAPTERLADVVSRDLKLAYGWRLGFCVERVEITVRGHAMAVPSPGFLQRIGRLGLRRSAGPLFFAHSDLSGLSLFEEAAWWGYAAADRLSNRRSN